MGHVSEGAVAVQAAAARLERAEPVVRRLLLVPERRDEKGTNASEASAQRLFNVSMALSGLRCLLGYVVLPIVTPALGAATRVGPAIGVPISVVALIFDVKAVRRFWVANHRWRWGISAIYVVVMAMVIGLLVSDAIHLA